MCLPQTSVAGTGERQEERPGLGHNEDLDSCARCAGGGQRGAEEGGEGT